MKLTWIQVRDFRNHSLSRLECGAGTTVLVGDNGEGKTNLVEAVSYVCLTKSFYAETDGQVVKHGAPGFGLEAEIWSDTGVRFRVHVEYDANTSEKTVSVNGAPVQRLSEQIGRFPIVVLSPEQAGITAGLPAERRRFLDLVISQSSRNYLEDLLDYRRALRQRNRILLDAKLNRRDCTRELSPWSESLVDLGARLTVRRFEFVENFRPALTQAYSRLAGSGEEPAVRYEPSVEGSGQQEAGEVKRLLSEALEEKAGEEQRLGMTLVGPHRDELKLKLGGLEARRFASQGQHKTLLIAMKLAELQFLKERSEETPMLVLDDVLSELDRKRSRRLLDLLPGFGQTFVTTTTDATFPEAFYDTASNRRVVISGGSVGHEENTSIGR